MAEQQIQFNLKPEVAEGTYANVAIIAHSPSEFVLDFARMVPGLKESPVVSRVIMSPENVKKLLFALQDNLAKYEKQFGTISIKGVPAPGSTFPMSFGGGEA